MLLTDILDNSVRKHPDKCAIRYGSASYSYSQLAERVEALAQALAARGVGKGDHIALVCANSNAYIEALFACARLGAVSVHFNLRLSPQVIMQMLERDDFKMVFCSCSRTDIFALLQERLGSDTVLVAVDAENVAGALCYEQLLQSGTAGGPVGADAIRPPLPSVQPSDTACMLFTSGTTGLPRGVLHSHQGVTLQVMRLAVECRVGHDETVLCVLPLFHTIMVSALQALYVGAELVIGNSTRPADLAELIAAHQVTRVTLVPYLMRRLACYVDANQLSLDSLQSITYGAEPMTPELMAYCQQQLGCEFYEGYGMTETFASVTMLTPEQHCDLRNLTTVGKPVLGVQLKLIDQAGAEAAVGRPGEILVKTDALMQGYWRDEEQTRQAIQDGWYHTGDIGSIDAQGFLRLLDRKQNMVISGGENIYPLEVSRCIRQMSDDVEDTEVFGVPDADWGEALVAAVVLKPGSQLSAQDIIDYSGRNLACYKKPKHVCFVKEIPRSETGKTMLDTLKQQVASDSVPVGA